MSPPGQQRADDGPHLIPQQPIPLPASLYTHVTKYMVVPASHKNTQFIVGILLVCNFSLQNGRGNNRAQGDDAEEI